MNAYPAGVFPGKAESNYIEDIVKQRAILKRELEGRLEERQMDVQKNNIEAEPSQKLARKIYEYYRTNKEDCDSEYGYANDPEISNIYSKVRNKLDRELMKVSIVILTANKYEKNILHKHLNAQGIDIYETEIVLFEKPEKHNRTNAYFFNWNGYQIFHIACSVTGSYTIGGCADAVRYCINNEYINPIGFVSFGICFGCREEENHLCDTVISRKVYPYFMGAKIKGRSLSASDDHVLETEAGIEKRIDDYLSKNKFNFLPYKVEFDNYITGEAVVSSEEARDMFTGTTTQLIYAGDMEAYGLFKECKNAYRNMPCFAIKSICDWGVEKNINMPALYREVMNDDKASEEEVKAVKNKLQALAAAHSFEVLDIILKGITSKDGYVDKAFESSFYEQLKESILGDEHEHTWSESQIMKKAASLNRSIHKRISLEFIQEFCECLVEEGLVTYLKDRNLIERIVENNG